MANVVSIDERQRRRLEHEAVQPAIARLQFGHFMLVFPIRGDALVWRWPETVVRVDEELDGA